MGVAYGPEKISWEVGNYVLVMTLFLLFLKVFTGILVVRPSWEWTTAISWTPVVLAKLWTLFWHISWAEVCNGLYSSCLLPVL